MAEIVYTPSPGVDSADDCQKCGWRFIEDIEKARQYFDELSKETRVDILSRIALRGAGGETTFLYLPDGIFHSAGQNETGIWMLLPVAAVINGNVTVGTNTR